MVSPGKILVALAEGEWKAHLRIIYDTKMMSSWYNEPAQYSGKAKGSSVY